MTKSVVTYQETFLPVVVGKRTMVRPIDHPSTLVSNTAPARTSIVIAVHDNWFETENTIYRKMGE